ncbi:ABC transporter D family member 2, chloroplastic-like, partial [Manihot esculenta]
CTQACIANKILLQAYQHLKSSFIIIIIIIIIFSNNTVGLWLWHHSGNHIPSEGCNPIEYHEDASTVKKLLISSRNLEFFTNGYRYLIQILPAAVVAPMYFSGKIEFGVINQSVSAFNHILGDFSLIVYQFQSISAFSAIIDRLGEFDDVLDSSISKHLSELSEEISLSYCNFRNSLVLESNGSVPVDNCQKLLSIENLTLQTPTSKATLIRDLSLVINEKDHLLVTGPSGSGKTSLLRALAGLWNVGRGKITFYVDDADDPQLPTSSELPANEINTSHEKAGELEGPINRNSRGLFFLPQRPYMVLGTLRQQLLYPTWADDTTPMSDGAKPVAGSLSFLMGKSNSENGGAKPNKPTTDDLIQVLENVRLGYILSRFGSLDSTYEWSSVLSLGEQQRLAFARLLLSKPKLVLLDESTSALDEANEAHLYRQIEAAGITYVSVGHRRTLYEHHNMTLRISTADPNCNKRNWDIESISSKPMYDFSSQ